MNSLKSKVSSLIGETFDIFMLSEPKINNAFTAVEFSIIWVLFST